MHSTAPSYMIGQCLEHQINSARVDYQRCNIKPFFFPWIPVILGKRQKSEKIPFSAGSIGLTSVRQHKESIRQSPPHLLLFPSLGVGSDFFHLCLSLLFKRSVSLYIAIWCKSDGIFGCNVRCLRLNADETYCWLLYFAFVLEYGFPPPF